MNGFVRMSDLLSAWSSLVEMLPRHIWHACVQGTLALVLVWGICRLFPRLSPRLASWLWRLGYLKLLVAFALLGSVGVTLSPSHPYERVASVVTRDVVAVQPHIHHLDAALRSGNLGHWPMCALMLIWGVGVMFFGIREDAACLRALGILRACSPLNDDDIRALFAEICREMGIRRMPRLLTGPVSGPLVCGCFPPSIVLPAETLAECSREDIRLILAHEMAHVKRSDPMWAWARMLAQWLLFLHPLVWLCGREWQYTQEAACDELAIRKTSASCADYGNMLLDQVVQTKGRREIAAMGISEPYHTLKRRLNAMSEFGRVPAKKQILIGVAVLIVAMLAMVPGRSTDHRALTRLFHRCRRKI